MILYTVSAGDTVFNIAARFGLSEQKICADNGLDTASSLAVGQCLVLLFPALTHTVRPGQTAESVCRLYGISTRTLFRNNYFLQGENALPVGCSLVIRYEERPGCSAITGGYVYDFVSEERLRRVISYMTYCMPFTYGFSADGTLVAPADERILRIARQYDTKPLMHLSTLTPQGYFSNEAAHTLLSSPESIRILRENILQTIREKGYKGLDVDFEYLLGADKEAYVRFIADTTSLLNQNGYLCVVALPPKTADDQVGLLYEGIDYAGLGEAANYSFLMTYEWGYRFGPPMAVAPLNAVRRVVEYAASRIPGQRLLLGLANYGYDWTLPFVRGESDAPSLSTVEALTLAIENRAEIRFDTTAASPYFYYTDTMGRAHVVWFEDARSWNAKLSLIEEYDLAGAFIWDLMRENPQGFVTLNADIHID